MAARPPLPPGPFLCVGLARSGRAAALALRARGEEVAGCDSGPVDAAARAEMEAAGVAVHGSTDGVALLDGVRTLIKSPGVPQEAAVVRAAREWGVPLLGELELGWRLLPNDVIAITGSNGKTTTTELVGEIHRAAGLPVAVAGNVGTALTTLAGAVAPGTVVVCEASSFQLEDTVEFAPDAAVLLNLAPDHLDRHGTFAAYREAKLRVFAHQGPSAIAVIPVGLEPPGAAARIRFASPAAVAAVVGGDAVAGAGAVVGGGSGAVAGAGGDAGAGATAGGGAAAGGDAGAGAVVGGGAMAGGGAGAGPSPPPDARIADGHLVWHGEPVVAVAEIRLRGAHNLENAMAAAAVTLARGVDPAAVRAALAEFAGVRHRLEEVGRIDGILYVDDSKATNVASAVVGIRSFPGGVHAILGGRGKHEDYAPLAAAVQERCRAAYLIGEEAERLRDALTATGVPLHLCGDLDRAVAEARAVALPGDAVLLSPACASYDQYRSFEQRGEHFKALARRGNRTII